MEDSSQLYSTVNCAFHTWHQYPIPLLGHCLQAHLNCCSDVNEAERSLPEWHFKGSSNKNTILICIPFPISVLEIALEDLVNDFLKVICILFDFSNFKLLFAHLVLRKLSFRVYGFHSPICNPLILFILSQRVTALMLLEI